MEFVKKVLAARALRRSEGFRMSQVLRLGDALLVPFARVHQLSGPEISEV